MNSQNMWLLIVAVPWIVSGPATAKAEDVQVNTYTTSDQARPSVAFGPNGDFVVVWTSDGSSGTDIDRHSIQGQRYAVDGSTVGGQFQINTYTTSYQVSGTLAMDGDGAFVVVWDGYGPGSTPSSDLDILGRRYAADGSPSEDDFRVNSYTTGSQLLPSIAVHADGDFVVVWQSDGSGESDLSLFSVQGQRYASDGSPVAGEFQVNTYTTGAQINPSVAMDPAGDFTVVWESLGSSGTDIDPPSIRGQRYAADGSQVDGEFQVNTYTTERQRYPSVAMGVSGDFVIVWASRGSAGTDTSSDSIQGQRFASDGSPVGSEFQVNSYTTDSQTRPSVAVAGAGSLVVVWQSYGSSGTDTSSESIQGQHYGSDGAPLGGEFQVNTNTTSRQLFPAVSSDKTTNFVAVWESLSSGGTDIEGLSVQRTPVALIFADGFESGDVSAWSGWVP